MIIRTTGANSGLAKVAVSFSAFTFAVKIANFAKTKNDTSDKKKDNCIDKFVRKSVPLFCKTLIFAGHSIYFCLIYLHKN